VKDGTRIASPYPALATVALPKGIATRLDGALKAALTPKSGLTAAVITDQGTWAGAVGIAADGTTLVPASSMAIGSVTKTFTAAEVLHLASRGQVDLDRKLSSYIELPSRDNGVTVREALTMRSGMREYVGDALLQDLEEHPSRHTSTDEILTHVPREVDKAGAFFEYSNTNFILLGLLIEEVTGRPYAQALRTDVLDPAGLTHVAVQDEERPWTATAPSLPRGRYLPNRAFASAAWAAGGMASDARSLARWGYLLYGGHLGKQECVAQMADLAEEEYGLGTELLRARGSDAELAGHRGEIREYHTALVTVRGRPLSVVVLSRSPNGTSDVMRTANTLLEVLLPQP